MTLFAPDAMKMLTHKLGIGSGLPWLTWKLGVEPKMASLAADFTALGTTVSPVSCQSVEVCY